MSTVRASALGHSNRSQEMQGRSQGRVPGILEPPFWVMKINIISRGKRYRNPPLEIPRDEIFVFEEDQKKIACCIAGYNILRVHKLDGSYETPVYRSLQCGNQQLSQPPILIVLFSLLR